MNRRTLIGCVVAAGAAALFARLGVWQLHRLGERRAFNAQFEQRLAAAPVPLDSVPADTAIAKYRRVRVHGTLDYDHQFVITGRSRDGAPGVFLITPLRPDSGARAVLVNRGWVYSPDASSVNKSLWLEAERTTVAGFIEPIAAHASGGSQSASNPRAWRELDYARASAELPYPIAPFTIVELANGPRPNGAPTRLELPAMDDGPHLSYAIQWFTFAAIALYGALYLLWLERRETA
ncbi:MAG TPA: SURF1 family protein [Gemmatimonadaceae bacterium]|nr:SURF1 family protein [Gemmatimonadaceae bacterium]